MSIKGIYNHQSADSSAYQSIREDLLKTKVLSYLVLHGDCTLAELADNLDVSVPTVTKIISELTTLNLVSQKGKAQTAGGRRPVIYGAVDDALYFVGVDFNADSIRYVVVNLNGRQILNDSDSGFVKTDDPHLINTVTKRILAFIRRSGVEPEKIFGVGVAVEGRVNFVSGRSYSCGDSEGVSLRDALQQRLNMNVAVENHTRACCYAESVAESSPEPNNMIYLNLDREVNIGIITDGNLYRGKSGFAGELGHVPFFSNEIICSCGKKGCLQTEASGAAIERQMAQAIENGLNTVLRTKYETGQSLTMNDIVVAALNDDTLSIELIQNTGEKLGKSVAFLLGVFNPQEVVLGGRLVKAGDCLLLPLKSAAAKFSSSTIYRDTEFRFSTLGDYAGALGAALIIRNNLIGV